MYTWNYINLSDNFLKFYESVKKSEYIDTSKDELEDNILTQRSTEDNEIDDEAFKMIVKSLYKIYEDSGLIMWNVALYNFYLNSKRDKVYMLINGTRYTEECQLGTGDIGNLYDCLLDEYASRNGKVYDPRRDVKVLDHLETI